MKNLFKKNTINILTICLLTFLLPQLLLAANPGDPGNFYGLEATASKAGISTERSDLGGMVGDTINYLFGVIGVIFLVVILIGGYMWMTAGGNEERAKSARSILFSAVIGLIIVLSAYAISTFVLNQLREATGS